MNRSKGLNLNSILFHLFTVFYSWDFKCPMHFLIFLQLLKGLKEVKLIFTSFSTFRGRACQISSTYLTFYYVHYTWIIDNENTYSLGEISKNSFLCKQNGIFVCQAIFMFLGVLIWNEANFKKRKKAKSKLSTIFIIRWTILFMHYAKINYNNCL